MRTKLDQVGRARGGHRGPTAAGSSWVGTWGAVLRTATVSDSCRSLSRRPWAARGGWDGLRVERPTCLRTSR
jgi:hypothetical protein